MLNYAYGHVKRVGDKPVEFTIAPVKISKMGGRYLIEIPKDMIEIAKELHRRKAILKITIREIDFTKV